MNTFSSSSSVDTHSPQPPDLESMAFSAANMQTSVSPLPSSSLHTSHHISLQHPTSETYDQNSNNNNRNSNTHSNNDTNNTHNNPVLTRLTRNNNTTVVPPPMMHDYWHGQTPLLLHNDSLRGDLDSMEVNHSERGIAGFVSKLYQSLQAPDDGQKYARWCKHDGKDMFIIECIPKFTEVVLPRLFKHCKFASFVRQLNIYGFQRDTDARKTKDTKDKESCRWHHPYFRPGRRDLFHLIRRKAARYPRPKRVKIDEDPATIVNVGSGDEDSDTEMNNGSILDDRRRSSSVSSISQQPHENFNNHHHHNQQHHPHHPHPHHHHQQQQQQQNDTPFQMMYEGLSELSGAPTNTTTTTTTTTTVNNNHNNNNSVTTPTRANTITATSQSISIQEQKQHVPSQQQQQTLSQQSSTQQQTSSPYNPPGEAESTDAYNTTPVSEATAVVTTTTAVAGNQSQHVDWLSQHNGPLDHRLLTEQDLRTQVTQLNQLCQGMRRSFDVQMRKVYKIIEDQERRLQLIETDTFRGSNQNVLQQQQQQQRSSTDMNNYMMSTTFSANHQSSPHNDLYTQFFPNNNTPAAAAATAGTTDIRIKTEIGATTPGAGGNPNNNGNHGSNERSEYENLYGIKLDGTTAVQVSHHHSHSHSQVQQQHHHPHPHQQRPMMKPTEQQQQWVPMFSTTTNGGASGTATDTSNSLHFQSTSPTRSGAAASIAAAAAVAAAAATGDSSSNTTNAPGEMTTPFGHPVLSKYHHHTNRGL